MLNFVLFAILKKVMINFILNTENAKRVGCKNKKNDIIITKIENCNTGEIKMHVSKT